MCIKTFTCKQMPIYIKLDENNKPKLVSCEQKPAAVPMPSLLKRRTNFCNANIGQNMTKLL